MEGKGIKEMYEYYRLYWKERGRWSAPLSLELPMTIFLLSFLTLKRRGDLMEQIER
jgi:hypothetical protein